MSSLVNHGAMRFSNLISFLILGILEASWAPMVPFIKNRFTLSEGELGWLLLCTGCGAVLCLPFAGFFTSRAGAKLTAYSSSIVMGLALFGVSLSTYLPLTALSLIVFGAMTISLDVSSNVNAVIVERICKRPLMSGFHGGYSLGALLGSFFTSLLFTLGFGISPTAGILLFVSLCLLFSCCSHLISDIKTYEQHDEQNETNQQLSKVKAGIPGLVIIIGSLCFIMYCAEGAVMSWSAVFAHQERGLNLEYSGYIYSSFAITMTASRLFGNKVVTLCGRRRTVVTGGIMVTLGFISTTIPNLLTNIAGFALIGLGTGNIVPQMVSFAGTLKGYPVHKTIAVINAFGYSGLLVGPVAIGFVAEHISIAGAFVMIGIFTFIAACVNFVIMRPKNCNNH